MRILFTGASSFTGYWFIKALAENGHEVTATYRAGPREYSGVRAVRVAQADGLSGQVFGCTFGGDDFLRLIRQGGTWDLFCHHAADVTDYKSSNFDVVSALGNNTLNLPTVLEALRQAHCPAVLLTGSLFEFGEGEGDDLSVISPYGLSKGLTAEMFKYYVSAAGMALGKFVIPNPFGPYEEARFTSYLVRCWQEGATAEVRTPDYVRDNIHVSLLAKVYASFAESADRWDRFTKINPCGYRQSQGVFAECFARQMQSRLGIPCPLKIMEQHEFPQPRTRVNTDIPDIERLTWSETDAWDELARYYQGPFLTAQAEGLP